MPEGLERMTDAELDRVVSDALTVEPSPNFVERVRTRIAAERAPMVPGGWLLPAMVGALLLAIAFGITLSPSNQVGSSDDVGRQTVGTDIFLTTAPVAQPRPAPSLVAARGVSSPKPQRALASAGGETGPEEHQVLISPSDAAAYRRLFASVGKESYEIVSDEAAVPQEKTMTDIDIVPIAISPLNPDVEDQGAFQ